MIDQVLFYIRSGTRLIPISQRDVTRFERYLSSEDRWTGCCSTGYGRFGIGSVSRGDAVMTRAHTFQWARHHREVIPEGFEIDHIDFDRLNLKIGNLRCIPQSVNAAMHSAEGRARQRVAAAVVGASTAGENHSNHKITDSQVADIRTACSSGLSQRAVARHFGISFQHVSKIVQGRARALVTPTIEV
jgi:DNA-binding transcriptional regulator YiaG